MATEIAILEQEQENIQDEDQALEGAQVLKRKEDLGRLKEDGVTLEKHLKDVTVNWSDIKARTVDHVDYAPSINVRVDEYNYTRDFGTFELEASKFQANFLGNVVDLGQFSFLCVYVASSEYSSGDKYDAQELKKFWTNATNRTGFKFPANRLLKIGKALTRQLLAKPDCVNGKGDPLYVVGKYGSKTGLRLGRYSSLEGYICTDIGLESKEVVVYNFDLASGDFSDHGDSGTLIWNGEGGGLALLHSGMPRSLHNHITFGIALVVGHQADPASFPNSTARPSNRTNTIIVFPKLHQPAVLSLWLFVVSLPGCWFRLVLLALIRCERLSLFPLLFIPLADNLGLFVGGQ